MCLEMRHLWTAFKRFFPFRPSLHPSVLTDLTQVGYFKPVGPCWLGVPSAGAITLYFIHAFQ